MLQTYRTLFSSFKLDANVREMHNIGHQFKVMTSCLLASSSHAVNDVTLNLSASTSLNNIFFFAE